MKNQVLDRSLQGFVDIASLYLLDEGYILNFRSKVNESRPWR